MKVWIDKAVPEQVEIGDLFVGTQHGASLWRAVPQQPSKYLKNTWTWQALYVEEHNIEPEPEGIDHD